MLIIQLTLPNNILLAVTSVNLKTNIKRCQYFSEIIKMSVTAKCLSMQFMSLLYYDEVL